MGPHTPDFSGMLQQQYMESKEETCVTTTGMFLVLWVEMFGVGFSLVFFFESFPFSSLHKFL